MWDFKLNPSELKKGVYDGYLIIMEGSKKISLPYLYVKEEPDYPRVMGFEFGQGDQAGTYRYEMYLPRGAEEFGIALYDADTLKTCRIYGLVETSTLRFDQKKYI